MKTKQHPITSSNVTATAAPSVWEKKSAKKKKFEISQRNTIEFCNPAKHIQQNFFFKSCFSSPATNCLNPRLRCACADDKRIGTSKPILWMRICVWVCKSRVYSHFPRHHLLFHLICIVLCSFTLSCSGRQHLHPSRVAKSTIHKTKQKTKIRVVISAAIKLCKPLNRAWLWLCAVILLFVECMVPTTGSRDVNPADFKSFVYVENIMQFFRKQFNFI